MIHLINLFLPFVIAFVSLYGVSKNLGKEHPQNYYAIIYTISMVFVLNIIVNSILLLTGEATACGNASGSFGKAVESIELSLLDYKVEFVLISCLLILAYIPSVMSYLWLGMFGVAQWRSPFNILPKLIVLSLLKFGATFVGFAISVVAWRSFFVCTALQEDIIKIAYLALFLLVIVTYTLAFFLDRYFVLNLLKKVVPRMVFLFARSIHKFLVRNLIQDHPRT